MPALGIGGAFAGLRRQKGSEHVKKVLFVCTANICRSPMAQEIFDALAEDGGFPFRAESAVDRGKGSAELRDYYTRLQTEQTELDTSTL